MKFFVSRARPTWAALFVLLSGCGGQYRGSSGTPVAPVAGVAFVGSNGYNGLSTALNATPTGGSTAGRTVATVSSGTRTLTITVPDDSLQTGQSFAVGTAGTSAVYEETSVVRAPGVYRWVSTAGTLVVQTAANGKAKFSFQGLEFSADGEAEGNPAAGTFTLSGTVDGVPFGVTGGGGTGALTFSGASGTNVNLSFPANPYITYINNGGVVGLFVIPNVQEPTRAFQVVVGDEVAVGETVTLTEDVGAGGNYVGYTEGPASGPRTYSGVSGTVTLVSRSASSAKVVLSNVRMVPSTGGTNSTATGSFVVNGSIEK